jgi:hypothetical protein
MHNFLEAACRGVIIKRLAVSVPYHTIQSIGREEGLDEMRDTSESSEKIGDTSKMPVRCYGR